MKKSILLLAIGCLSAAMLPGIITAQSLSNHENPKSAQTNIAPVQVTPFSYASFDPSTPSLPDLSSVNLKAVKDFKGRFATVKDEKWFSVNGGFMTYFTQDGFGERVFYSKKGHWQGSLRFCSENKLPQSIRATVRSIYFDFNITIVELVEVPGHMVYIIHLEDATNIKIIRVSEEGEMDIMEEYTKA